MSSPAPQRRWRRGAPGIEVAAPESGIYEVLVGARNPADPHEWPGLPAGGEVAARSAFPGCAGYIADPEKPDFRLRGRRPDEPVRFGERVSARWGGAEPAVESGTGFFVSEFGHLLTNLRVADGCGAIALRLPGRLGKEVVVFGFSLRGALSPAGNLTTGVVTGLSGIGDDLARFQNGSSGSPAMDRTGAVVGMASSSLADDAVAPGELRPQDVNFAVRAPILQAFLQLAGVEPEAAPGAAEPDGAESLTAAASRFTAEVVCYR